MPTALVIRTAGTNCDEELVRAFTLAGASAETVHVDRLIAEPSRLASADLIGLPGGFSYGDDIASGRILAMKLRERLWGPLRDAGERGTPIIGVCNGFQVLVQVGLLPGPPAGEPWPDAPPRQTVSLAANASAGFVDTWTPMLVEPGSACVWTRGLAGDADVLRFPSAHGEGRFVAPPGVIADLERTGRVALRYADNFNGSAGAIAGICDASGRILGLMPHPERYLDWSRHPFFPRLDAGTKRGQTPGLKLFRNAVEAATEAGARPVH